jgi:POT family proton-dependent oligopeptide transporter
MACKLFLFLPVYQLSATGLDSIINSMGGAMTKEGVPNDLLNNFNSITLITVLPMMKYVV